MKHNQIVKGLVKKYKADKNVIGIYVFGSLAKGTITSKSDIDIEIIFKKRKKKYELINKKIKGIAVDLSLYDQKQFIKDFSKYLYLQYAALDYKILYDPKGILKKYLGNVKKYFQKHPEIIRFWKNKEKKWKDAKKKGNKGTAENYFDIMKELKKRLKCQS